MVFPAVRYGEIQSVVSRAALPHQSQLYYILYTNETV